MKRATLIGLIGAVIPLFTSCFYTLSNMLHLYEVLGSGVYVVGNLLSIMSHVCIIYFFVQLYKRQK